MRIARWPQAAQQVSGVSADIPARKAPVKGFPYHIAYLELFSPNGVKSP